MKKIIILISIFASILCVGCSKSVKDYNLTVEFQGESLTGKYTGDLIDDVPSGSAVFAYNDNGRYFNYEGNFSDGKLAGKGKVKTNIFKPDSDNTTQKEGTYNGDLVDGIANGYGVFTSANSSGEEYTYSGRWNMNSFNGYGRLEWKDTSNLPVEGNFENGEYKPSKLELIKVSGEDPALPFMVTHKIADFIEGNDEIFPTNDYSKISRMVNPSIEFEHLFKNISEYNNELIKYDKGQVKAINEFDSPIEYTILQVAGDDMAFYYIFYFDKLPDISNDDNVTVYGLPISTTRFENIGNSTTEAVVLLGSYIEKNN